ncbi:MAG TPA: AAA family ATPase [Gemmataceae bacterium]|jgi:type II secretory pathway predicted ATPase ExeA
MYETHFQLRQRPFPATPDPCRYYPATSHERAIARLLGGLDDGEGVLALTGAPGTGKTLLCHCLLERIGARTNIVFLTNSHAGSRAGLLQAILYDLSLPYEGRGEQEMRLALTDHLLRGYEQGRSTTLLLDESQHLTSDLLEELRLFGNLEARRGKAIQVVLVGQPALLETLRRPELTALRQRLAVRAEVEPLALQEAADYLLHHVRIAGGRPERLFADEALELLSRQTQGVPRLLNQAAHQALNLAAECGAAQVDAEAALEALALLGLSEEVESAGLTPLGNDLLTEHETEAGPHPSDGLNEGEDAAVDEEENASCRLMLASGRAS